MRNFAIPLILLPILIFFNISIFQKEDLRRNGDLILIELAPVDPRSLMQGDYMRLRYKLIEEANKTLNAKTGDERSQPQVTALVLETSQNKQATFKRLHHGEALGDGELLLSVQHHRLAKPQRLKLTPTSFFFQEGHASLYQEARFGLMRVAADGAHLLVGLADDEGRPITP